MQTNNELNTLLKNDKSAKKVAYGIYYLYLIGVVLPMLPIVGIIFAYIFENDAQTILKSHYQYLIRSFWIGLLYFTLSTILIVVAVGLILVPICILWWLIRMIRGLKALMRNEPILNPKTWIF